MTPLIERLSRTAVRGTLVVLVGVIVVVGLSVLAVTPLALGAGKPPAAGKYTGKTSEGGGGQLSFTVSANKKEITAFTSQVGYNGKCGQGGGPTFTFEVKSMAIGKGGAFSATVQGADNATKTAIKISGSIAKKAAHGSIATVKPWFKCQAPNQATNPYSETFSAKTR